MLAVFSTFWSLSSSSCFESGLNGNRRFTTVFWGPLKVLKSISPPEYPSTNEGVCGEAGVMSALGMMTFALDIYVFARVLGLFNVKGFSLFEGLPGSSCMAIGKVVDRP